MVTITIGHNYEPQYCGTCKGIKNTKPFIYSGEPRLCECGAMKIKSATTAPVLICPKCNLKLHPIWN